MEHVHEPDRLGEIARDLLLDLDVDQVPETHRKLAIGLTPLGGRLFDAGHLPDERAQHRRWSTQLTSEHPAERAGLLLAGCAVHHHSELPTAIGHDRWTVDDQCERQSAHVNTLDVAAIDVK